MEKDAAAMAVAASPMKAAVKAFLKWGAVGAFAALVAYGGILTLLYLFASRPLTRDGFFGRFAVQELASFKHAAPSLYRNNARLDQWLRRLAGIQLPKASEEEIYDMAAANLSLFAASSASFVIAGGVSEASQTALQRALAQRLPDKIFLCAGSFAGSAAARTLLRQADAVILAEEYGVSRYGEVSQALSLAGAAKVQVAGAVLY